MYGTDADTFDSLFVMYCSDYVSYQGREICLDTVSDLVA